MVFRDTSPHPQWFNPKTQEAEADKAVQWDQLHFPVVCSPDEVTAKKNPGPHLQGRSMPHSCQHVHFTSVCAGSMI